MMTGMGSFVSLAGKMGNNCPHQCTARHIFLLIFSIQSTPDNSNLQGKSKKVRVIGSSSYRELRTNDHKVSGKP